MFQNKLKSIHTYTFTLSARGKIDTSSNFAPKYDRINYKGLPSLADRYRSAIGVMKRGELGIFLRKTPKKIHPRSGL